MSLDLAHAFREPAATWRAIPFWSLNDLLEPEEVVRQLEAFARGGFGGAYLHSRIGLLTPYLGPAWWEAMDAGVAACERLGIEAWFYDEDKWPSGFAGGIVPRQDERFRSKHLARLPRGAELPAGCARLGEDAAHVYYCRTGQMGDAWFNGTCWVDLLEPGTVQAFIDCTYKPYAERYAGRRRDNLRGIFTDEPQVSPRQVVPGSAAIPFSPILLADVRERCGYDLLPHLPALFDDAPDAARIRLDYFRTLAWRLEQSFSVAIGGYCAANGLTWTGHYNGEQSPTSILRNVGDMMVQYRHMQQPGIDHLGLSFGRLHDVHAMKSLSSVANQYGQERRLSEMFGISGQNMDFEDRAWIADGHAVLGINHICPHLSLYSLKGCRKRDYPPTISPQQPWWEWNRAAEDRMARTAFLSSQGSYGAELLLIHPLESAYVELAAGGEGRQPAIDARFAGFCGVLGRLQDGHRDYDLGDEQILADIGAVGDGQLRVGRMAYRIVVLPSLATIRPSTVALLEALAAAGGAVIAVDALPALIDGRSGPETSERLRRCVRVVPADGLLAALAAVAPPAVRLCGDSAGQVWMHRRLIDGRPLVMLFNRSRLAAVRVEVAVAGLTDAVVWDPADGACRTLAGSAVELAPAQTLFIGDGTLCPAAGRSGAWSPPAAGRVVASAAGPWRLRRLDPNAITLDMARASLDGGATWGSPEPVIGLYQRFTRDRWSGRLLLRYAVEAAVAPAACDLVVEQPGMYRRIAVNGVAVSPDGGFWRDRSWRTMPASGLLRPGPNTIELELDFVAPVPDSADAVERYGSEIESIWLIGDFAVAATPSPAPPAPTQRSQDATLPPVAVHRMRSFALAAEPTQADGDLVTQGYPFFAGALVLERMVRITREPGRRYRLRLRRPDAIVVQPRLNGVDLPALTWSPWSCDIGDALRDGDNRLELTLVGSLRNLLGPHHHREGELTRVGPDSFGGRTAWTSAAEGDEDWFDVRLQREPRIWRDDYHLVAFGLAGAVEIIAEP